ncbi:MAG: amidohydrolase family protein [Christensenellaceae bacterium]
MNIKIKNATLVTNNDKNDVIRNGELHISEGLISYAGSASGAPEFAPEKVVDAKGNAVMPGFFNMHTHIPMNMFRSYADDLTLMDWLNTRIFPAEDKLTAEMTYWASMAALIEMAKAGIAGFNEMYFHVDAICRAALQSGLRAIVTRAVVTPAEGVGERMLGESVELFEKYNGQGRIKIYFAPHAQYTVNNAMLEKIAETAKSYKTGVHMHISETQGEHEACIEEHGKTPIGLSADMGLLDVPFLAAHCVWVSDEDMDIMAQKGASVLSCPRSNLKLGSGVARLADMLDRDVHVTFGTDGAASNNKLSVMDEMTYGCLLQKGMTHDASVLPAPRALKMATLNGAQAMGVNSGVLEKGRNADIIILDISGMRYVPDYDVLSNIVYAGSDADVTMNIVGGDILFENGGVTFADEEEVKARLLEYAGMYRE